MSWKDKLANKSNAPSTSQPQITINNAAPSKAAVGGWRLKMQDPVVQSNQPMKQTRIDVNDTDLFPALGSAPAPAPKNPVLTGYASLAKSWAATAKEDAAREETERAYHEQQEYLYNYNSLTALNTYAINNKLMACSTRSVASELGRSELGRSELGRSDFTRSEIIHNTMYGDQEYMPEERERLDSEFSDDEYN
jgi:hypothetical protein